MAISMEAVEVEIRNLKHRVEGLEGEVSKVKLDANDLSQAQTAISTKLNMLIESLGRIQQSIDDLKERPGKRWESLIMAIIGALAGAFIAYILR